MFKVVDSLIDVFLKNTEKPPPPKPVDPQKVNLKNPYPKIKPSESATSIMNYRQRACELKLDVKYHKFEKDILKFVAPYFNFDTKRLFDAKDTQMKLLEKDSESSAKPKKIIKKSK